MAKKPKVYSPQIIFAIIAVLILLCVLVYRILPFQGYLTKQRSAPYYPPQVKKTRVYESKNLKLKISIPFQFNAQELNSTLILNINERKIVLGRNTTSFNSIEKYVDAIAINNNLNINDKQLATINNYSSEKVELSNKKLIYYIYVDGWVYSLSTDSPELYADLDQIAQSFHYIP